MREGLGRGGKRSLDSEPFEAKGKAFSGEIYLKHSPALRNQSWLRRMKDWRSVEPDISSLGNARGGAAMLNDLIDFANCDPAPLVRSGRNEQRCIRGRHIVKVRPNCHHSGQQVEWWSHMSHTALDSPWAEAGSLTLLRHANGSVLMPPK